MTADARARSAADNEGSFRFLVQLGVSIREVTMRHTLDLSNVLAFAPRDTPLSVVAILGSEIRKECERRGIHEGDRITCNETLRESLLVRGANVRMLLSLNDALLIEVAPGLPS